MRNLQSGEISLADYRTMWLGNKIHIVYIVSFCTEMKSKQSEKNISEADAEETSEKKKVINF